MAKPNMASHFLLLILALSAFSASSDVNIDCGSSDIIYTDDSSIIWSSDSYLIQTGETQVVPSSNSKSHIMDTLRVFTTRKKNCYSFPADNGQRGRVRASFYYGNYDQKSSPPTFDLLIDGNLWATVETSITDIVSYELVYVVKGDSFSVCVAQTQPNQFPFISALVIRSFDSKMYSHIAPNHALVSKIRIGYGADDIVRYPDDIYDRIWTPATPGNGFVKVTSDAIFIDVSTAPDNPPLSVIQNAIALSNASQSMRLYNAFPASETPAFINMYFSEVTQLDSTEKRSFDLLLDGKPLLKEPIVPTYGNVTQYSIDVPNATSNTSLVLAATSDSALPPLINAMEVFYVMDVLTDGTNSKDVKGLASLIDQFSGFQEWSGGDPCLPAPYTWDWINCSTDATPRVTALYLRSFDLSGSLPDFSSMDALETIDFSNNSLNGGIPDFLGTLPKLKQLNLADNEFSGPIPSSLSKNNNLKLVVTGNPDLCTSGKSCQPAKTTPSSSSDSPIYRSGGGKKKKGSNLGVILGSTIPSFFVFWGIVGFLVIRHNKIKSAAAAAAAGKVGGANEPNGHPQGTGTNGHMAGGNGQQVNNEFNININMEEQAFVAQDPPASEDHNRTN